MKSLFSSSKKTTKLDNNVETILGESVNLEGNLDSSGTVKVDGQFIGDITTKSDVIVGQIGYVKGNISAVNVVISGKVDGNINCSGLLQVSPSGKITGDIETVSLAIEDGGIVNGRCSMTLNDIKRIIAPDNEEINSIENK